MRVQTDILLPCFSLVGSQNQHLMHMHFQWHLLNEMKIIVILSSDFKDTSSNDIDGFNESWMETWKQHSHPREDAHFRNSSWNR